MSAPFEPGERVLLVDPRGRRFMVADIGPGNHVLEAGTGSGALTIALCRAAGPEGRVVSYEARADFHERASANIEAFFGKAPAWLELRMGDVRDVATRGERFDR